jgi:Flp pilus assembly pilin Flp
MTATARLLIDDSGQDVIEYVLLASFLGFAALGGVLLLRDAMKDTYASWDSAVQQDVLVEVPEPKAP